MDYTDFRLRCLELALRAGAMFGEVVDLAMAFEDYILGPDDDEIDEDDSMDDWWKNFKNRMNAG